jgi:hypothetical protein
MNATHVKDSLERGVQDALERVRWTPLAGLNGLDMLWIIDLAFVLENIPAERKGTLRKWMESHLEHAIHTVQLSDLGEVIWLPALRKVTRCYPTYALINQSRCTYSGMTVVVGDDDAIVVRDSVGGGITLYALANPALKVPA